MLARRFELTRAGLLPAGGAVVTAGAVAMSIALSGWSDTQILGRVALGGAVLFAAAVVVGSARLVSVATIPVLGAAIGAGAEADGSIWIWASVLGSAWYVAVELAWHSIERRERGLVSRELTLRRVHEVATVVIVSLIVTTIGFATSDLAPERSLVVLTPFVLGLFAALGVVRRLAVAR